mgnify:CR=1 FL=1
MNFRFGLTTALCIGIQSVCGIPLNAEELQLDLAGEAAVLMNAKTGHVLFQKQAHASAYPASTTKIATALYTLSQLSPDELNRWVVVDAQALKSASEVEKMASKDRLPSYLLEPGGSSLGLQPGETLLLKDLLAGMMISSGNDASNVIAQTVGGSIPQFLEGLNRYLKEIGCLNTCLLNPHGLHHPNHVTTAWDLAWMAKKAMDYPQFREWVRQTRFAFPKTEKRASFIKLQTNRLLRPGPFYYSKAIGIKTGYHRRAKKTLVAAASQEERVLIAVLLRYDDSQTIFRDAIRLFEAAFNQPKVRKTYLQKGQLAASLDLLRAAIPLRAVAQSPLFVDGYPSEETKTRCWAVFRSALTPPIRKGEVVGEARLLSQEKEVMAKVLLVASEDVSLKWPFSWGHRVSTNWVCYPIWAGVTCGLLCSLGLLSLWRVYL